LEKFLAEIYFDLSGNFWAVLKTLKMLMDLMASLTRK